MLSSSLQYTPLAALSRPIAGTIGSTIITTLPGSVKAVKEILSVLFRGGVIEHAVDLIKGGSGQRVHATLAAESESLLEPSRDVASHNHEHDHHHHHHGSHRAPQLRSATAISHDPSAPGTFKAYIYALTMNLIVPILASARHRQSPYPQISPEKALSLIRENIRRLSIQVLPVRHFVSLFQ
jgi:gephyrin